MTTARTLAITILSLTLSAPLLSAQTVFRYRDFELGANVAAVSALAGVAPTTATTIHERPALLQQLEWRTAYSPLGPTKRETDSVERIAFSFYNDQLSRMVIDYDHSRTTGMTDADMIEALSGNYGMPLKAPARKTTAAAPSDDTDFGTPVARWGDTDHTVVLYRSFEFAGSTDARFWLIVTSPRLEALAKVAAVQAIRQDDREAPQRAIAQQKKDTDDARVAAEKARTTNKAAFRP